MRLMLWIWHVLSGQSPADCHSAGSGVIQNVPGGDRGQEPSQLYTWPLADVSSLSQPTAQMGRLTIVGFSNATAQN